MCRLLRFAVLTASLLLTPLPAPAAPLEATLAQVVRAGEAAVADYRPAERLAAARVLTGLYFDAFEPVEAELALRDREALAAIEAGFAELNRRVMAGRPPAEVRLAWDGLRARLAAVAAAPVPAAGGLAAGYASFMVTLREGLEAFLVVAVMLTYLRQTGRQALVPAMHAGVAAAIAGSLALGVWLARVGGLSPLWESALALVAAVLVVTCTVHIMQVGGRLAGEIRERVASAARKPARAAQAALFLFAFLMVGREGVETATMIASLAVGGRPEAMVAGGIGGVAGAGLIALAWLRLGRRIRLGLFFQVTAVFMLLFALQLLIHAFNEFAESREARAWLGARLDLAFWSRAGQPFTPQGEYGVWLTYALVALPLAFVAQAWRRGRPERAR